MSAQRYEHVKRFAYVAELFEQRAKDGANGGGACAVGNNEQNAAGMVRRRRTSRSDYF